MPTRKRPVKRRAAQAAAHDQAAALARRYPELFDFAPVMWLILDSVGIVVEINPGACQTLGQSKRLLVGSPFTLVVSPDSRRAFIDHLRRCRATTITVESELDLKDSSGASLPVRLYSQRKEFGARAVFATVALDMAEQMALEQARHVAERQKRRAEHARRSAQPKRRRISSLRW